MRCFLLALLLSCTPPPKPQAPAPPPCLTVPPPPLPVVYLHDCGKPGFVCVTLEDTAALVAGVTQVALWAEEAWRGCGVKE